MTISRRRFIQSVSAVAAVSMVFNRLAHASAPFRIGVIGAGALGSTVGRLWVQAGHEVMFSSRHPEELQSLQKEAGARASVGLPAEAAGFGTVLLLAMPFEAVPQIGQDLRQEYAGKFVLDSTNPWGSSNNEVYLEARKNGVAQTVKKYFPGARLVRAFSCVDASVIESAQNRTGERIGMPVASDDRSALDIATLLVREANLEPVVVGNMANATLFEPGGPGWRAHLNAVQLRKRMGLPATS